MTDKAFQEAGNVYCLSDDEKVKFSNLLREHTALGRLTHDEVMAIYPFMEAHNFWVCVEDKAAGMPRQPVE